jgi:two-component system OmpR family response regulator
MKAGDPSQRRVLIVEDNVDAAETLQILLRLSGYDTRAAHDGGRALDLAREWKPGAVLLDIGLPGKDGYQVARELRALPEMRTALLVALTGYGGDEDRKRASECGFDTLQVKPVEPATIEALLDRHFKSAGR